MSNATEFMSYGMAGPLAQLLADRLVGKGEDSTIVSGTTLTIAGTLDVTGTFTAVDLVLSGSVVGGDLILSIADGTNTLQLVAATHANRTLLVLDATLAITLPEATGTGDRYKIVQGIAATSSTIVTKDTSNAGFYGMLRAYDDDVDTDLNSWNALPGVSDTITFNGVATGGKIYDHVELIDIATDKWLVSGQISQSGGSEVTPFSSAA